MQIELAKNVQKGEIFEIYNECRIKLDSEGVYQWNLNYPTLKLIENDILSSYSYLYILSLKEEIIGAISISSVGEEQYKKVKWINETEKFVVIHRLAVSPKHQHLGYGKALMDFAENYAVKNCFTSIRLDAFSGNGRILKFYEERGYVKCGEIFFPGRNLPFYCYEMTCTLVEAI